jgi:hypothetical protein
MIVAHRLPLGLVAAIALCCRIFPAAAQEAATLHPIPAAECRQFAGQIQGAIGFTTQASEDDFSDLLDGAEGRSCHIAGSAANQSYGAPGELMAKVAAVFSAWRDDPARSADGPGGTEKGFVSGSRIATVEISWEPGPGANCSDKAPLSACNITPQQKMWNVIVDIVEKAGK